MIHLAITTDRGYLPWAATAIGSALAVHETGELSFHLLHDGLSLADLDRMARFVGEGGGAFHPHAVTDTRLERVPSIDRFPPVVWFRFLLPEVLAQERRVLFLDADTFVVTGLDELWRTELAGLPLAAVANVVEPRRHAHIASLGVADPKFFLNSGVLLMDLDAMRAQASTTELIRVAMDEGSRSVWPDQDVLNVVFEQRWQPLHPRWNAMNSLWTWTRWAEETFGRPDLESAKSDPGILHFEGPAFMKPWHQMSAHPWRDPYREALRRTPWADVRIEDRTVVTRAIGLLPERWRLPMYLRLRGWAGE